MTPLHSTKLIKAVALYYNNIVMYRHIDASEDRQGTLATRMAGVQGVAACDETLRPQYTALATSLGLDLDEPRDTAVFINYLGDNRA